MAFRVYFGDHSRLYLPRMHPACHNTKQRGWHNTHPRAPVLELVEFAPTTPTPFLWALEMASRQAWWRMTMPYDCLPSSMVMVSLLLWASAFSALASWLTAPAGILAMPWLLSRVCAHRRICIDLTAFNKQWMRFWAEMVSQKRFGALCI